MSTLLFDAITLHAGAPSDILGLWQRDAAGSSSSPAGTGSAGMTDESVTLWSYDLPRHPVRAAWVLKARARRLGAAEQTLPGAEQRLAIFQDGLVRRGASFALSAPAQAGPEHELQMWLQAGMAAQAGGLAFGPLDALQELWDGARRLADDVARFAADVRGAVAPQTIVATGSGPSAAGRSELSWLGSCTTWLRNDLAPVQVQLHVQAVRQVLQTRRTWLRIGLLVVGGATGLASLLGANPFALLAVYRFVRRLIEEYRTVRQTILVQPT
jgi:hypothetical protein